MKPPFSYYGGKQNLASRIVSLFPQHETYVEPFLGGGAIFWTKEKSVVEVINDTNRELINFYQVVQQQFSALEQEIAISLHSRDLHRRAWVTYQNPDMFSEVKRAWAVWVLANQGFASKISGVWGYDKKKNTMGTKIRNRRESFTLDYAIRMQDVQIECADALRIIRSRDHKDAFFYCDPPYFNSDCGHYDGYSEDDFTNLLKVLSSIEGKFILSSYPSKVLDQFIEEHGWRMETVEQTVSVARTKTKLKKKTEVITRNF
jgi:DNA adenine methylase